MSRFVPPSIPTTADVQALQRATVQAFQNLVAQLNAPSTDTEDLGNHRILNVAWPALGGDAVPLDYLRQFKFKGTATNTGKSSEHYGIVFTDTGVVSTGDVIPAYPVPSNRTGTPAEGVLYALTAPSSSALKFDVSVDGTSLFGATGVQLGVGTKGPVDSTAFVAKPKLKHNSVVLGTVLAADGTVAGVTFVLSVMR